MGTNESKPVVGFIGVGLMGHGMARNILAGGFPLRVMGHRNRTPVDDLLAQGATEAASPKELAETCDIIQLCLPNSKVVEATMRGDSGILAGARPGLIVIDSTTADPVSTLALAAELAGKGAALADAPLGRTPAEAQAGTLDAMVGCDDTTWDIIAPVIDRWAGNITRTGDTGTGHQMKLLMNFLAMGYGALYSEAAVLGAKVGISPQTFRSVIGGSRLSNGFFETFMRYMIDRDRDAHKFTIENASKDVRYAANMASDAGIVNIMGAAIKHYYTHVEAIGKGGDYVPMLSDHVAALNGLDMAEEVKKNR